MQKKNAGKDVLIVCISDMHSGSTRALFPGKAMPLIDGQANHTPTKEQIRLHDHWLACADKVAKMRNGKQLIIIHNGDAIDGCHHNTIQVVSPLVKDHVAIHLELMEEFIKLSGFSRTAGDKLYYTTGTESHTGTEENEIAERLNAEPATAIDGMTLYVYDELRLTINGRRVWFTHHGPGAGRGFNEGNAFRNWLRDIYWDCFKAGLEIPDIICTGHVHRSVYNTYVANYHTLHGIILPSWQLKTRYAYAKAPLQRNDIGIALIQIGRDGIITIPPAILLDATLP